MLTMNFFNGFRKIMEDRSGNYDRAIRAWAATEYKFDAEYAYNIMKATGKAPDMTVNL